jgi:CheY-like chemotaxis protein
VAKIILVADDDPRVRRALCELFEREADYDLCEQAKNGAEAVEIATRCKPDLIILDFSMPLMGGIAAAKQLKQLMPEVLSSVVDRIVPKTEMANLLDHVRDLTPA